MDEEDLALFGFQPLDLDDLHLRKIDLADEVLILNVGGYIGKSTRREWHYAKDTGKRIRWLEPDRPKRRFDKARYMQYRMDGNELARYMRAFAGWFTVVNRALVEKAANNGTP